MDEMGKIRKKFYKGSITERALVLLEMHGYVNQAMLQEMLDIRWDTAEKIIAHLQVIGLIDEGLNEVPVASSENKGEARIYDSGDVDDEIYDECDD